MATYQEQIAQRREETRRKALVSCAELSQINNAMMILEREGIIDAEARIVFLKAYVIKHPEINKALGDEYSSQRSTASEGSDNAQAE